MTFIQFELNDDDKLKINKEIKSSRSFNIGCLLIIVCPIFIAVILLVNKIIKKSFQSDEHPLLLLFILSFILIFCSILIVSVYNSIEKSKNAINLNYKYSGYTKVIDKIINTDSDSDETYYLHFMQTYPITIPKIKTDKYVFYQIKLDDIIYIEYIDSIDMVLTAKWNGTDLLKFV